MDQTLKRSSFRFVWPFFLLYLAASLVHFVHNAVFLREYPGLPETWTAALIYGAWVGMSCIGVLGMVLLAKGHLKAAMLVLAVYAMLGLDSLGHYAVASFTDHDTGMNTTILLQVSAAAAFLTRVSSLCLPSWRSKSH